MISAPLQLVPLLASSARPLPSAEAVDAGRRGVTIAFDGGRWTPVAPIMTLGAANGDVVTLSEDDGAGSALTPASCSRAISIRRS